LIDAAPGGHPATQAAAQKTVAKAKQVAKTNPTVQTALDAAHHAASQVTMAALGHVPAVPATPNTMAAAVQKFLPLATSAVTGSGSGGDALPADLQSALSAFGGALSGGGGGGDGSCATVSGYPPAYQVAQIIKDSKAGNTQARQALTSLRAAAARGDHEAKAVLHAARRINHTPPAAAAPAPVGAWYQLVDTVGGWYDIVGAAIDDVRTHAQSIAGANNAGVVGVIRTARGVWQARGFRDADAADNWLGSATTEPESFTYAAIFDKDDILWPHPLNEKVGTAYVAPVEGPPIHRGIATASGAWG